MGKSSPAKYIRTLIRRRDRLAERIGSGGRWEDYDRMEHAALEWALPILKERSPTFGGQATPDFELLRRLAVDLGALCDHPADCDCSMAQALRRTGQVRASSPGPQRLAPVDVSEPEGACPRDPDGLHHVGCGC